MIAIPVVELLPSSSGRSARAGFDSRGSGEAAVDTRALAEIGFSRIQLEGCAMAARGDRSAPLLEDIVRDTDAAIQVAEASSGSEIERMLRAGAEYVLVGARSLEEPDWLREMAGRYPESIVVRTDVRDRRVVQHGWVRTLPLDIYELVEDLNQLPLAGVVIGGLQLDGATRPDDLALVEDLVDGSRIPLIVSAKLTALADLRAVEHRGAAAVVLRGDQLTGELAPRLVAREFGS
jgi:phosphoribosylformimino-5-aminoimidazole carboxamide ribonucleotide (ProFAR) isomerase